MWSFLSRTVTVIQGGEGVIALLLCNRDFLKFIFFCNYIKIELKIQRFVCM